MPRTPTTLQPRRAAQTRSSGPHHERVADPRCTAVASCSIGGCDPSSVISFLLCCAVSRVRRAPRKKYVWIFVVMVKWSRCPNFGFDGVSLSLAEFMSIFFFSSFFFQLFFCIMYVTQTPQTRQTAHEQCRVRATTSWLQRHTRLPPASRAGSNTTRVR